MLQEIEVYRKDEFVKLIKNPEFLFLISLTIDSMYTLDECLDLYFKSKILSVDPETSEIKYEKKIFQIIAKLFNY